MGCLRSYSRLYGPLWHPVNRRQRSRSVPAPGLIWASLATGDWPETHHARAPPSPQPALPVRCGPAAGPCRLGGTGPPAPGRWRQQPPWPGCQRGTDQRPWRPDVPALGRAPGGGPAAAPGGCACRPPAPCPWGRRWRATTCRPSAGCPWRKPISWPPPPPTRSSSADTGWCRRPTPRPSRCGPPPGPRRRRCGRVLALVPNVSLNAPAELVFTEIGGDWALAWRVVLHTEQPWGVLGVYVDARGGKLLGFSPPGRGGHGGGPGPGCGRRPYRPARRRPRSWRPCRTCAGPPGPTPTPRGASRRPARSRPAAPTWALAGPYLHLEDETYGLAGPWRAAAAAGRRRPTRWCCRPCPPSTAPPGCTCTGPAPGCCSTRRSPARCVPGPTPAWACASTWTPTAPPTTPASSCSTVRATAAPTAPPSWT